MMRATWLLVLALAACGTTTAVEIDVSYSDDWGLTALQLTGGERAATTAASHRVTLLVPDDWSDAPLSIAVVGMRDTESFAEGAVSVVPERGGTARASAHLALLSCPTSCVEGTSKCIAGGLSVCEQRADSCFDFGAPAACDRGERCAGDGCVAGDPVVLPSNSQTLGTLEQTGITLDLENGYVFDTSADCYEGAALGNCAPIAPGGAPETCVCRADTVTIHDLEVRGARALAILAWTSVTVKGNLVMKPGAGTAKMYTASGSAGGSYGTVGGNSGAAVFGNAQIVPLAGGMTGQGALPGLGGGALQITADQLVRIEGTISVPGGGAGAPTDCSVASASIVGDGGGSGGGLLLEARHVNVVGGVAANGGGGASGGFRFSSGGVRACGVPGTDGVASPTTSASGGPTKTITCSLGDPLVVAQRGAGGAGSLGDGIGGNSGPTRSGSNSNCSSTSSTITGNPGGGGGGAGRIRINTFITACGCTGFLSPTPTYGMVVIE